jgi:hypothetical protein
VRDISQRAASALVVVWLVFSATNLLAVGRFRYETVAAATLTLAALLAVLARTRRTGLAVAAQHVVSLALVGVAVAVERMRFQSYLPRDTRELVVHLVALSCVIAAALWSVPRRTARTAALAVAGGCLLVTSWLIIDGDPAPRIDVWYSLDQGTQGLLHGQNIYEMTWVGSPGVKDAFTYLPTTAVLLGPWNWLLGDVRWGLTAAVLVAGLMLSRLARESLARESATLTDRGPDPRGAVLLLWLTPGQLVLTEQSWTEPLLLCLLVGFLWCVSHRRLTAAVLLFAVALACKQHMVVLLPVLACWRAFGVRRAVLATVAAVAMCLPWFLAGPRAFVHDTFTLLVQFHVIPRVPNLYVATYRNGWPPPFWLSGLIVLATVAAVSVAVRREQPGPARLSLWLAFTLLAADLVNKQTFYNQYWLVGSLVLVALATGERLDVMRSAERTVALRDRPSATRR